MGAYAGQIPCASFFNTTAASIGQVNPGLLRPVHAITMCCCWGWCRPLSISSWNAGNNEKKELLAVGETLGKANAIISRYVVHDKIACVAKAEADFRSSHEPAQFFEVVL